MIDCCQPPLNRSTFMVAFSLLLIVMILLSAFGLEFYLAVVFLIVFGLISTWLRCYPPPPNIMVESREEEDAADKITPLILDNVSAQVEEGSAGDSLPIAPVKRTSRFDYLDNLKSSLTVLVVYHHATCSMIGGGWIYNIGNFDNDFKPIMGWTLAVNQSYFMCLFFFISGYFSSSSMRKKGRVNFILDRMKRIGVPLYVWTLVFAPLCLLMVYHGFMRRAAFYYPSFLQCWYLAWLILLSGAYCFCYDEVRDKVPPRDVLPPPLLYMLGVAGSVCFIINTALLFIGIGSVMGLPVAWGSLPFDVVAFFLGATLEHRKTLSNMSECLNHPRTAFEAKVAKVGALATIVIALIIVNVLWYSLDGALLSSSNKLSQVEYAVIIALVSLFLSLGMVFICYSAIVWSFERLNYKTPFLDMLSGASYAVYIIHPYVVCLATYSWVGILASMGIDCEFPEDSGNSSATPFSTGLVFAGWLYCVVLSQLIVWPLAHFIRQLPVIRNYL